MEPDSLIVAQGGPHSPNGELTNFFAKEVREITNGRRHVEKIDGILHVHLEEQHV